MRYALNLWNSPSNLFDFPFNDFFNQSEFVPAVDVQATDTHYVLSVDVPGLSKKDISVEMVDEKLVLSGERKQERKNEDERLYLVERSYGSFRREFKLPRGIDSSEIEALHKDGVLRIAIPKGKQAQAQKVAIKEANNGFFKRFLGNKEEKEGQL